MKVDTTFIGNERNQRIPGLVLGVQSDRRGINRATEGQNGKTRPASMKTDAESQG